MNAFKASTEQRNDFFFRFLVNPEYRVFRHLLLLTILISGIYNRNNGLAQPIDIYSKVFVCSILLFLFYINMYLLIPKFIFRDKYFAYFLWICFLFCIVVLLFNTGRHFVKQFTSPYHLTKHHGMNIFTFFLVFVILIAASAAMKLFQRWILDSRRIYELEKATMLSELEQLKNQVNPHFLLNTLNNANVLIRKDPGKASQVLMKLSDLLRYQLYDNARRTVLLTAEIQFLEDFLNLEKIRRDNFEFTISKEGNLSGVQIAPSLFITFAENAVKHNMDAEAPSYVYLFFNVNHDDLYFRCVNSKPQMHPNINQTGGLGLANVKRRLELLYPGKHHLLISNDKDTFSVDLNIRL